MADPTIETIRSELSRCVKLVAADRGLPSSGFKPLVSRNRSPAEANRYFSPALLRYRNLVARDDYLSSIPSLDELASAVADAWAIEGISCEKHENGYITFEDTTNSAFREKETGGVLDEHVDLPVIGDVVESTYQHKWGTPRQGGFAKGSTICIQMRDGYDIPGELTVEDFCIVLWACHLNEKSHNHLKAKVRPPKNNGVKVGVFACRSPYRPTSMGMSICRVAEVTDARIELHESDMILGTPVLSLRKFTKERYQPRGPICMPRYVTESVRKAMNVMFSTEACREVNHWPSEMKGIIVSTLEEDPRSIHSRRKHKNPVYAVDIGCEGREPMRVIYRYRHGTEDWIEVVRIEEVSTSLSDESCPAPRTKAWLAGLTAELADSIG
ncbi:conserved hypothetical protein [Perkinsus marinus ATCC 50983]|uniref:TsaA-like domain-containing protein n=1 Tax=Perkinsus marinus (strain ATCC 50983 / TXsc) TaxID=423536 RepID=C5LEN4_PERM5|nr:conserved hypothetical protein [Perkinsus marinus ATCC 50983]EER04852.1 conserved hypothetical protein [Perkinsus marinus ATCC 50983]|eukprot:XP_002773036.1 conserved hypothetical protein [Perkinsus marinus ATCC 50983]